MRYLARLLGIALLLGVLALGCASTPATTPAPAIAGAQISIKGFAFNPNQPSVAKGATITWTNDDGTTHTVTSGVQTRWQNCSLRQVALSFRHVD